MKRFNEYIFDNIVEWMSDLKPQAIFLIGLPAAGKSTFLKNELEKYLSVKNLKTNNTDNQVETLQYETALEHYNRFKEFNNIDVFNNYKDTLSYKSNTGNIIYHKVTIDYFKNVTSHKQFYRDFYKNYYSTYFYIRDAAKVLNKNFLNKKVGNVAGGDALIFDGTGTNISKIISQLEIVKLKGFKTTMVFLDTPYQLCIQRDIYRGKTQGRTVGDKIIKSYVDKLQASFNNYKSNFKTQSLIDVIMHFKWIQKGDSPIDGHWDLVHNRNIELIKNITNIKINKMM